MRMAEILAARKARLEQKAPQSITPSALPDKVDAEKELDDVITELSDLCSRLSQVKLANYRLQANRDAKLETIEAAMNKQILLLPDATAAARFRQALAMYRARNIELMVGEVMAAPSVAPVVPKSEIKEEKKCEAPKPARPPQATQAGLTF